MVKKERGRINITNIALLLASLLITLGVCEAVIRIWTEQDSNGQRHILNRPVPPCYFDTTTIQDALYQYNQLNRPPLVYHPELGWTTNANVWWGEGYRVNGIGIRSSQSTYTDVPADGVLRIALFGDSFTFGVEVDNDHTWASLLQSELRERGLNAEVMNFGVPGYGIDQAYLRYLVDGQDYQPDVVIFGFNPENANRNPNIVSPLYFGPLLPFTKPRFIKQDGRLELVNSPAIPPEEMLDLLADLESAPWIEHEYYYPAAQYRSSIWFESHLLAFTYAALSEQNCGYKRTFPPIPEINLKASLTPEIVRQFATDVQANDSVFVVLQIPIYEDVSATQEGRPPFFADFIEEIQAAGIPVIAATDTFTGHPIDDYFSETYHHSEFGQATLAHAAADTLLTLLDDGTISAP